MQIIAQRGTAGEKEGPAVWLHFDRPFAFTPVAVFADRDDHVAELVLSCLYTLAV